ncbi:MAG: D-xylose-proton symporter [uncultured bacterium]|nr:MAG: D-xylose-proton symporter [uncultured bacterium]
MTKNQHLIIIATCSALSGLLFGYDAGIIAGALLFINKTFSMSANEQGWLVAMVPLGALLSSIVSGEISDLFGRKKTLFLTAITFIAGSLICALTYDVTFLIIGRLLLGIAIGIGSSTSPVYTSELADEKHRGWLVNLFVVFIQLGVFLSFVISFAYSHSGNWRDMIGLGVIPAIILMIAVFFLPESPRWLIAKNRSKEAKNILLDLYSTKEANQKMQDIEEIVVKDKVNIKLLFEKKRYLKVIFIGAAVSFFTQTVGINAFNYYAPTIFQKTGFASPGTATFYTMFMGLVLVLSTISSLFFIDRIGRKKPLLIGTFGILLTLLAITLGFALIKNPMTLGWIFLISALVFMAFHGVSIGPACFLIPSEIFPLRVRGLGMGISVAFNWGANVIVAALVPTIIAHFGVASLFGAFFVITIIAWLVFYFYIPETKGTTLEQIERNVLANVPCVDLGRAS